MASITINMRSDWLKREYKHLRRATSIDEDTRDVTRYSVMAWKSVVYSIVNCAIAAILNMLTRCKT